MQARSEGLKFPHSFPHVTGAEIIRLLDTRLQEFHHIISWVRTIDGLAREKGQGFHKVSTGLLILIGEVLFDDGVEGLGEIVGQTEAHLRESDRPGPAEHILCLLNLGIGFHEEDFEVGVRLHDGDGDGDLFADAVRVGGHFGPEQMEFMSLQDGLDSVGFLELKVLGLD